MCDFRSDVTSQDVDSLGLDHFRFRFMDIYSDKLLCIWATDLIFHQETQSDMLCNPCKTSLNNTS